jgi:FkbM family methyltransferase
MGVLRELYRRCHVWRHRPHHWRLRPDTIDRRIFRHVVIDNEYRLPERFDAGDILLDVGAHIGSFALAALQRGAGRVYCCEPDRDNFRLLEHNLSPYHPRVSLLAGAVWRSDQPAATLGLHNPLDPRNTGACRLTADGHNTAAFAFDDLVDQLTQDGRRLRLVKLDCEGAEWPILLTSRRLGRIQAFCGEYHLGPLPGLFRVPGFAAFGVEALVRCLSEQGFRVETQPLAYQPFPTGLFFAGR